MIDSLGPIILVLKKMGFDEIFIFMVILVAEVLIRSLNRLHNHQDFHGFYTEKRAPR